MAQREKVKGEEVAVARIRFDCCGEAIRYFRELVRGPGPGNTPPTPEEIIEVARKFTDFVAKGA
jgi:hypothetical protein